MTRFLPISLFLGFLLLLPVAAAHAQGERVTDLARGTPVREYDGRLLFSRWDGGEYHLSTWHDGTIADVPVPASSRPFDADIGRDRNGRPAVVVSICDDGCDIYVSGLQPGARPRRASGINARGRDEVAPSIWNGRLVFGRRSGPDRVIPYAKAPGSPVKRLGGLPATRCGAFEPPRCRPIEDVRLVGMELHGRWVAQSWTYQPDAFPGSRQNEIRLTRVGGTGTRRIAAMTTGEGGQVYLGPSIADRTVGFFRGCQGDALGCSSRVSGAIRYRIATGAYRLAGANESWTGWAWSGAADYHVPSAFDCGGGDPGDLPSETCGIYRRDDLAWKPIAARHIR
jgi:hypothetical protein